MAIKKKKSNVGINNMQIVEHVSVNEQKCLKYILYLFYFNLNNCKKLNVKRVSYLISFAIKLFYIVFKMIHKIFKIRYESLLC